jgi:hypothetical protein
MAAGYAGEASAAAPCISERAQFHPVRALIALGKMRQIHMAFAMTPGKETMRKNAMIGTPIHFPVRNNARQFPFTSARFARHRVRCADAGERGWSCLHEAPQGDSPKRCMMSWRSLALLLLASPAWGACVRPIVVPVSPLGVSVIVDGTAVSGVFPQLLEQLGAKAGCQFVWSVVPRIRAEMMFEDGKADLLVAATRSDKRDQSGLFGLGGKATGPAYLDGTAARAAQAARRPGPRL